MIIRESRIDGKPYSSHPSISARSKLASAHSLFRIVATSDVLLRCWTDHRNRNAGLRFWIQCWFPEGRNIRRWSRHP